MTIAAISCRIAVPFTQKMASDDVIFKHNASVCSKFNRLLVGY
jgi:hypothetical protein